MDINNFKNIHKNDIQKVIKMNIIKNAISLGWNVENENNNKLILRKKISSLKNNEKTTDALLDTLLNIQAFEKFDKQINNFKYCCDYNH
jgi:hypothetical protein